MATPSERVDQFGRSVKLHKAKDQEEVSYEDPMSIMAIISSPRDSDDMEELGRIDTGERTITVAKDIDITNNRYGLPDVVEIDGEYYQVDAVMDDQHPMMDVWKKTVTLEELDAVKHSVLEP